MPHNPFYDNQDSILNALKRMESGDTAGNTMRLFESRADAVFESQVKASKTGALLHESLRQLDCIRAYDWLKYAYVELTDLKEQLSPEEQVKVAPFVKCLEEAYEAHEQMKLAATDTFGGKTQWDFSGSFDKLHAALAKAADLRQKGF